MIPDKTPAERLAEALYAAHDAAYAEAFRRALSALDVLAAQMAGRTLGKRATTAIRNAYGLLAGDARSDAKGAHGIPAIITYPRGEELAALAKARCEETLRRLGGAPPVALPVVPEVDHCHADRDGDCRHADCPQLRDGEPAKSKRSCPLPDWEES